MPPEQEGELDSDHRAGGGELEFCSTTDTAEIDIETAEKAATEPAEPEADVREAEVLNNRGIAFAKEGKFDDSLECYEKALQLRPAFAEVHNNRGIVFGRLNRLDEAVACYREALRVKPEYPEAYNNMGIAFARMGKGEEAIEHFEHALRMKADYPEALNNLANATRGAGDFDKAIEHYRQAIAIRPDYPEAYNNLANALAEKERLEEAVEYYEKAIAIHPRYAEAHNNYGNTLSRLNRHGEAEKCYQRALRYNPDYAEAYNNLANALADRGRLAESVACYRQALRINPNYAEAYNNLGITLAKQSKLGDADACYVEALRLKPDYPDAHLNRALAWLQAGQFELGWTEYEWRFRCRDNGRPEFPTPPWCGEPLNGRTILIYAEQGLGDTLQFIRLAPLVKQRGGNVVFECQPPLIPLLSRCAGIDRLITRDSVVPEFHAHCALLSLPKALRLTVETVPGDVPYLYPDPQLVAEWRRELADFRGFRIGIAWQGNPQYKGDKHRSYPLRHFAPLAALPGVRLFSLQKGFGSEQIEQVGDTFEVIDLAPRLDQSTGAFMDTAAVMANLDLVIAPDTATIHLAGGLGVPAWLPTSWTPDWRWLDRKVYSPWYPTVRMFHQVEPCDWTGVFAQMADELRPMLEARGAAARTNRVTLDVEPADLVERLIVLERQHERVPADRSLQADHAAAQAAYARLLEPSQELSELTAELKSALEQLHEAEAAIRHIEGDDSSAELVGLARTIARQNERRANLKRQINALR
jgi:tetratricopeptide (TPR) repeat protein